MNAPEPLQCREMSQRMDTLGNRMTRLETKFDNGINTRMSNLEHKLETLSEGQLGVRLEIAKGMGRQALMSLLFQGLGAGVVLLLLTWYKGP